MSFKLNIHIPENMGQANWCKKKMEKREIILPSLVPAEDQ
jgi:hypothetical protein